MITEFGKFLRKIRIDRGEILKDMADKLGVTPAFLSAVEVGKKNVPETLLVKISYEYELSDSEKNELIKLSKEAVVSVKINLCNSSHAQRNAAIVFARDFSTLSEDTANKIVKLLKKESYN